MTVRREKRGDRHAWVLDILYRKDGRKLRYRRDAQVQTAAAARAEERRLIAELGETGTIATVAPRAKAETNTATKPSSSTFDDAATRFFEMKAASSLKPSSRTSYREIADRVLLPKLENMSLGAIDFTTLAKLDADLAKDGLGASSRRNVHVVLRSIVRFAVESGHLADFPKLPKLPKVGRKMLRVLTSGEVNAIITQASAAAALAFSLSAFAGLRKGEVRGLEWRDVDLRGRTLIVRQALSFDEVAAPKSGHERIVPLTPKLTALLTASKPNGAKASDPVALTSHGKLWGPWGLKLAFERAQKRAHVEGFRFHDLRHYFVTQLFRDGCPAPAVQLLAGHHSLEVTQRYAHMVATDLRAAIDRLDRGNSVETSSASDV